MHRVRIRQVLLLLIRMLIIFFIVIAFARPAIRAALPGIIGGAARTTAAILLDNSYSMSFETDRGALFELAKEKAMEVIDLLHQGDELLLVPFSDRVLNWWRWRVNGAALSQVRSAILRLRPSYRTTDVAKAVEQTLRLLKESDNPNLELYLITDLEQNGWTGLLPGDSDKGPANINLYVLPIEGQQEENVSIDRVILPNQVLEADGQLHVKADITNHSRGAVSDLLVSLNLDGKRAGQVLLDLRGGQTKRISFNVIPEKYGRISGYVEIEWDRLLTDNRRYFSFYIPGRIKALLVGGQPGDTYFIRQAINPPSPSSVKEGLLKCREIGIQELTPAAVENSDVIVLANVPRLSNWQLERLQEHVVKGRGLLICLGRDVDAGFYNRSLFPKILGSTPSIAHSKTSAVEKEARPAKGNSHFLLKKPLGGPDGKLSFYSFGQADLNHPVLRGLPEGALGHPRFYMIYDTTPSQRLNPIVLYNNGSLALGESALGRGKIIVYTSSVDLQWTDLPIKGIFAPLFHRIAQYLAAGLPERSYLVGDTVRRDSDDLQGPVQYEDPDGNRVNLLPTVLSGRFIWQIKETEYPGIWRLFSKGQEADRIALNVNPEESNPEKISIERAREIFKEFPVRIIRTDADLRHEVLRTRYGTELWKYCILLALSLMAAEMIIARKAP